MTERLAHGCTIRTWHLPHPHALRAHLIIPASWQLQLYGELRIADTVQLCPTHDAHAHLCRDAAVGQMLEGIPSVFDHRQFGRELWGWAEDAGFWLMARRDQLPAGFAWRTARAYALDTAPVLSAAGNGSLNGAGASAAVRRGPA